MSTYPTLIDSFTAQVDGVDVADAADVNVLQQAIVAIETFLGKSASVDNTTIEYALKNISSLNPGHKHSGTSITTIDETQINDGALLARVAAAEVVGGAWRFNNYVTVSAGYGQLPSTSSHLVIGAGGATANRVSVMFGDIGAADKMLIGTKNAAAIAPIMTLTSNIKSVNFHGDIGSASALCIRPGDNGAGQHTQLSGVVDFMPALGGATPYVTINGTGPNSWSTRVAIGLGTASPTATAQLHIRGAGGNNTNTFPAGYDPSSVLFVQDMTNNIGTGGCILLGNAQDEGHFVALKSALTSTVNPYNFGSLSIALRPNVFLGMGTDGLNEICRFIDVGRVLFGFADTFTPLPDPLTQFVIDGASNNNGGTADTAYSLPASLSGWAGCHLYLRDSLHDTPGYGGIVSFGCNNKVGASVKYIQVANAGNTRGHLAFSLRGNAGDATLTEVLRLYSSAVSNEIRVGIGTTTPTSLLDVNGLVTARSLQLTAPAVAGTIPVCNVDGDLAMVPLDVAVSTTAVDNLDLPTRRSVIRFTGGVGDFTFSGIRHPAIGKLLVVINATPYQMTLVHEATSTGTRRLWLSEQANLTLASGANMLSVAMFIYTTVSPGNDRWLLISARSATAVASTRAK